MLNFLRANVAWMLVALAMSSTLWATVATKQNPEVSSVVAGVPVELRDVPSGLVATSPVAPVNVEVRAPSEVLQVLFAGTFRAHVDLTGATAGVQELPVHVDSTDRRVRVERFTPDKLTIRLEVIKRKEVPVRLDVVDNPPFGYTAKVPKVTPDHVTVSGPEGQVNQVISAGVVVRLDNVRSSLSQPLRPVPQDSGGEMVKDVTTTPESVLVEVPIEQQLTYKVLPVVPQVAGNAALGYQVIGIMVDPTAVTVFGDPTVLEEVSFLSTKPVDVSGATADIVANGELTLPSGVSLVRRQPITVRLYVSPIEANKVVRVVPQLKGLGDHLRAETSPNTVDVTVSGPMPLLSTLRAEDVRVSADLTGVVSSTQPYTLTASVPAPLRVDNISPRSISITVRPQ